MLKNQIKDILSGCFTDNVPHMIQGGLQFNGNQIRRQADGEPVDHPAPGLPRLLQGGLMADVGDNLVAGIPLVAAGDQLINGLLQGGNAVPLFGGNGDQGASASFRR